MAEKNPNFNWLKKEKVFLDRWVATININGIEVDIIFEGATAPENRFLLSRRRCNWKYSLDLGCDAGENGVYCVRKEARCVAGDFYAIMVEVDIRLARRHGVEISARFL
jgi:hypothetical protein